MSPIYCQTDGYIYCLFLLSERMINMVITIRRETGSDGHTIVKMLAERLGYDFYDKELISLVTNEMHLNEETIAENGETISAMSFS